METRKLFRIMMLVVMFYSTTFGTFQMYKQNNANQPLSFSIAYAEKSQKEREIEVKNYNNQIYTENEFSGKDQGYGTSDFFKKTNKELEAEHKKLFGNETFEEEQKRVEETGLSNQPVLGEYRPDDTIGATSAGGSENEEEKAPETIDPNDPKYQNAYQKCIDAGYDSDRCKKIAPALADCFATQSDVRICAMIYNVALKEDVAKDNEAETNGTGGFLDALGKYFAIFDSDQPWYGKAWDFVKEGASDIVSWAKENPFEFALTVATFVIPFGPIANLAIRGALRLGGFALKSGRVMSLLGKATPTVEKIATKLHDVNTSVMKKYNNLKDRFLGTKGSKTITVKGNEVTTFKNPLTGQSYRGISEAEKGVSKFSRNEAKLGTERATSQERVSALRDYLAQKEKDGIPLSKNDRLLKDASDQLGKLESEIAGEKNIAKSLLKNEISLAEKTAKQAEKKYNNFKTSLEKSGNPISKGQQRVLERLEKEMQNAKGYETKTKDSLQTLLDNVDKKHLEELAKKEQALGKGFKILQESAGNYGLKGRVGTTGTALGLDVYNHDANSDHPVFSNSPAQERAATKANQTEKMTPDKAQALKETQSLNEQRIKEIQEQQKYMVEHPQAEQGASLKHKKIDLNWNDPHEMASQGQATQVKAAQIEKQVMQTQEYQDLQQNIQERGQANARIEHWLNDASGHNDTFRPYGDEDQNAVQKFNNEKNFYEAKKAEYLNQFNKKN